MYERTMEDSQVDLLSPLIESYYVIIYRKKKALLLL